MTPELEQYYSDRFSMFATQGWRDLMEDAQKMLDASNSLSGVTPENLGFKQGELSIMRWLLSLKQTSENAYQELQNETDA